MECTRISRSECSGGGTYCKITSASSGAGGRQCASACYCGNDVDCYDMAVSFVPDRSRRCCATQKWILGALCTSFVSNEHEPAKPSVKSSGSKQLALAGCSRKESCLSRSPDAGKNCRKSCRCPAWSGPGNPQHERLRQHTVDFRLGAG